LRLADNPALEAACRRGGPVVPVFIWAPEEEGAWSPGSASRWWLHQSLEQLVAAFDAAGSELVIRRGSCLTELQRVAGATGADAVFWNRRYEPASIARDRQVEEALRAAGPTPKVAMQPCSTSPERSTIRPAGHSKSSHRSGEPASP
jgi:deoxyribodipyrimidine photo-lyase